HQDPALPPLGAPPIGQHAHPRGTLEGARELRQDLRAVAVHHDHPARRGEVRAHRLTLTSLYGAAACERFRGQVTRGHVLPRSERWTKPFDLPASHTSRSPDVAVHSPTVVRGGRPPTGDRLGTVASTSNRT